jgi:hypothetical protein
MTILRSEFQPGIRCGFFHLQRTTARGSGEFSLLPLFSVCLTSTQTPMRPHNFSNDSLTGRRLGNLAFRAFNCSARWHLRTNA